MIKSTKKKQLSYLALAVAGVVMSAPLAHSNDIYVAADTYEYEPDLGDFDLNFNAKGIAIGGSFDVTDSLSIRSEFGSWQDDESLLGTSTSDFESTLISFGADYYIGDWEFSGLYSNVKDDIDIIHGNANEFRSVSDMDLMSLRFTAGQEKSVGKWAYFYEGGLQYSEAETGALFDDQNTTIEQDDEVLLGMIKVGGDHYFASGDKSGLFFGGSLSWYEKISSETNSVLAGAGVGGILPRPLRPGAGGGGNGGGNGGGVNINRTFGDSFGIAGLYATYKLDDNWSLDLSSSFGFSGEKNATSHALTLSYAFN